MGMTTTIAITTTVRSRRCSIMIMIVVVILFLLLLHFIFQSIRFFTFYSYSSHCCDDVFTCITFSLTFVVIPEVNGIPVSSSTIYFCVVVFGSREFFGLSVSQKELTVLNFIGRENVSFILGL